MRKSLIQVSAPLGRSTQYGGEKMYNRKKGEKYLGSEGIGGEKTKRPTGPGQLVGGNYASSPFRGELNVTLYSR